MVHSSYNSLLRLLRVLAEAALTHYDVGSARLALLSHHRNTVFRVDTLSKIGRAVVGEDLLNLDEGRYVLRLCDPHGPDLAMIRSEAQWLLALRQDTNLYVPEPVPARDGSYVSTVQIEDIELVYNCLLLRWVPGRMVDSGLSPTLLERVGTAQASLHQHARTFQPPENFIRPSRDWLHVLSPDTHIVDSIIGSPSARGLFYATDELLLKKAAEYAWEWVSSATLDPTQYGLVHGDLQQAHYVFYRGNVHVLGFDDCGYDYFLSDSAVTLQGLAGRADEPSLCKAYWQGYERVLAAPAHADTLVNAFSIAHMLHRLQELMLAPDSSMDRNEVALYLKRHRDMLSRIVSTSTL